ncbi:hypothetical protein MMC17_004731 [Xylographa soralifera]|nr:hypothetical protein [Xylographa soralifera]
MFKRTNDLNSLLHRLPPSTLSCLLSSPLTTIATILHGLHRVPLPPLPPTLKVVCLPDTHNRQPPVPVGDILLHAGDLSQSGTLAEIQTQLNWLKSLPHAHKIFIAGNHDLALASPQKQRLDWDGLIYLEDSSVTIDAGNGREVCVYGSPWTRKKGNWVFEYARGEDFWKGRIPIETDVLVTHMPPMWRLDGEGRGDEGLLGELWRVRPRLHVFGHEHEGHGKAWMGFDGFEKGYEAVRRGDASVVARAGAMCEMVMYLLIELLWPRKQMETRLVNAAVIGGHRDDLQRAPTIVEI